MECEIVCRAFTCIHNDGELGCELGVVDMDKKGNCQDFEE